MQPTKTKIHDIENHPHFEMVKVEGGTFGMGEDKSRYEDEKPAHKVQVSDFYIGKYPITQAIWEIVIGKKISRFERKNHPMTFVSWDMIIKEFIPKLNELTGKTYRLPSEAEWEYAAKGGKYQGSYQYSGSNHLKEVGWYNRNSRNSTKPVGMKMPNALWLYDMSGNVLEWCADHWHENSEDTPKNGSAWLGKSKNYDRLLRGGSWIDGDYNCRVSNRFTLSLNFSGVSVGFRVSR